MQNSKRNLSSRRRPTESSLLNVQQKSGFRLQIRRSRRTNRKNCLTEKPGQWPGRSRSGRTGHPSAAIPKPVASKPKLLARNNKTACRCWPNSTEWTETTYYSGFRSFGSPPSHARRSGCCCLLKARPRPIQDQNSTDDGPIRQGTCLDFVRLARRSLRFGGVDVTAGFLADVSRPSV